MKNFRTLPGAPAVLGLAVALALPLAGCGGGGGDSGAASTGPSASVSAADVSATGIWNTATTVPLSDHISAPSGSAMVTAVGTPAHGQAVLHEGQLVYTPAPNYFGPDQVTYTATADNGATTTAKVTLQIGGTLTLSGTVAQGELAGAQVDVTVGTTHYPATADAHGHYQVAVDLSGDPQQFVTVSADGGTARPDVKLASLAGSLSTLALTATRNVADGSAAAPGLNAGAYSTALAVLAAMQNGGTAPGTDAQFAAADLLVPSLRWATMANLIEGLIDRQLTLPAGKADTLAAVSDPSAYESLVASAYLRHLAGFNANNDGATLMQGLHAGVPLFAGNLDGKTVLIESSDLSGGDTGAANWLLAFSADGTVTVTGTEASAQGTWTRGSDQLAVSVNLPWPYLGSNRLTTGLVLRQVGGSPSHVTVMTSSQPLSTSTPGYPVPIDTEVVATAYDLSQSPPAQASEFAANTRWAGFNDDAASASGWGPADAFDFSEGLQAVGLYDSKPYVFSVEGTTGEITVRGPGGQRSYRRVRGADASGAQLWMMVPGSGTGQTVWALNVVATTKGFAPPLAEVAHFWFDDNMPNYAQTVRFVPGGVVDSETFDVVGDDPSSLPSWSYIDGELSSSSTGPTWSSETGNLVLSIQNGSVCVLQTVHAQTAGSPATNGSDVQCMLDLGPA